MIGLAWTCLALALLPLVLAFLNLPLFHRTRRVPPAGTCVSILIPARDEAQTIEAAVGAALASRGVTVEVVVLDDQSSDGTADLVARMAAADGRVRLVPAPPLPVGWAGKQHACARLAGEARHPLLLFVDADIRLAPEAAARLAGALLRSPALGLLSAFPRQRTGGWAEHLVVPWIHVLLLGYLPFAFMRVWHWPAFGAGCGQVMFARGAAYRDCGGHAATPGSRHDGLSLPRTFRRAGWMTDIVDGHDLAAGRMYDSPGAVWRGFGKSAGEGLATPVGLPVWTLLILGGHVAPWLLAVGGLLAGAAGLAVLGGLGVAAGLGLRTLLALRFAQHPLGVLLHPAGALFLLALNWAALLARWRGRPARWRGRQYPVRPS